MRELLDFRPGELTKPLSLEEKFQLNRDFVKLVGLVARKLNENKIETATLEGKQTESYYVNPVFKAIIGLTSLKNKRISESERKINLKISVLPDDNSGKEKYFELQLPFEARFVSENTIQTLIGTGITPHHLELVSGVLKNSVYVGKDIYKVLLDGIEYAELRSRGLISPE